MGSSSITVASRHNGRLTDVFMTSSRHLALLAAIVTALCGCSSRAPLDGDASGTPDIPAKVADSPLVDLRQDRSQLDASREGVLDGAPPDASNDVSDAAKDIGNDAPPDGNPVDPGVATQTNLPVVELNFATNAICELHFAPTMLNALQREGIPAQGISVTPYGDGRAASRIADTLARWAEDLPRTTYPWSIALNVHGYKEVCDGKA